MWKFNWTRYVGEQIKWAEILITKADEIRGYDSQALRNKGVEILADVSRLVGEDMTGEEFFCTGVKKELTN